MTDQVARRTMMVDTQIRPSDVTKYPIIEAFLLVPREEFVPSDRRETAYASENIELGQGRVVLEPRTFAKMLDVVDIQPRDLVLDVGPALGYSTAILSRLAETVIALEEDPSLAREAEQSLAEWGADNAALVEGSLVDGAPRHGPYDVIIIEGAVENPTTRPCPLTPSHVPPARPSRPPHINGLGCNTRGACATRSRYSSRLRQHNRVVLHALMDHHQNTHIDPI